MRGYAASADEMLVASAFIDEPTIDDILDVATKAHVKVRVLTGTLGHFNRQRMFANLERRQRATKGFEVRIWNVVQDAFHTKLYLFRRRQGEAVAWIGSANFTRAGLRREGELVAEFCADWGSPDIRTLRRAFEREWRLADPLDRAFVDSYVESAKPHPDLEPLHVRRAPRVSERGVLLVGITHHVAEGGAVERRVDALLHDTAKHWMRLSQACARDARRGDPCVIVSRPDEKVFAGVVSDRKPDGKRVVLAYNVSASHAWNAKARTALGDVGVIISASPRIPRARWLEADWADIVGALRRASRSA